jgi:N-acetyl-gamma-glutamyl-phosphate reductase common form
MTIKTDKDAGSEKKLKVAILGSSGYVGGNLIQILINHPNVTELRTFSISKHGLPWKAVHPQLNHCQDGVFETYSPNEAAKWADVLFLALPHGSSQVIIEHLEKINPKLIIDLSADFRIHSKSLYEEYYGFDHATSLFNYTSAFKYGLADILGSALIKAQRISVPGCFATATLLGLYPFTPYNLDSRSPICFAITGSSGSGKENSPSTHHSTRANNFFAYNLGKHRHQAEINEQLNKWTKTSSSNCTLIAHSAPLVRGIYTTICCKLSDNRKDPLDILRQVYEQRPFIKILHRTPEITEVIGTNFAHIFAVTNNNEIIITVAIDNLIKGAAGQAVQTMNLALEINEVTGLTFAGIHPL